MARISSQRTRIQKALVDLVKDETFPQISYNPDGSPREPDDQRVSRPEQPILCNETQSVFSQDERHRRGDVQRRDSWLFSLKMTFKTEVLMEIFEDNLVADPPVLEADKDKGLPQVVLRLVQTDVSHPVQQGASVGTQAEFTFEAELGRR